MTDRNHLVLWICLALGATAGCGVAETETVVASVKDPTPLSRRELTRNYYESRRLLIVYGSGTPVASDYEAFAREYAASRSSWTITIQPDSKTTQEELAETPVYLVGTPRSNRWISRLAMSLPIAFEENGFRFLDKSYEEPSDVLKLFFPNPANQRFPLFLTTGNSDEQLRQHFGVRLRGDFQVLRSGKTLALGSYKLEPGGGWVVDPGSYRVFESDVATVRETEHFAYFAHGFEPGKAELEELARRNEALYQSAIALLSEAGNDGLLEKIRYHLYRSGEDKGLITDNTQPAHLDLGAGEIHAVAGNDKRGFQAVKVAEILVRSRLGEPKHRFLEKGLSVYLSRRWNGYEYWAARLSLAGQLPPLSDLLDDEALDRESNLIVDPISGAFVGFVLAKAGSESFLENYSRWTPTQSEVRGLESEWKKTLAGIAERHRLQIEQDRASFPKPSTSFQKGFTHAHEGYRIYDGYLSKRSDDALRQLESLGTDAVAVVPYTFMEDPTRPVHLPIPRRPGSETDEGVIHSLLTAKGLGMTVMLKPQIWTRGWPGDIRMDTDEDREAFFDHYYRWIRHYAMLAEIYQVEFLCVGVELVQMTVGYQREWVEMIEKLRKIYSGPMVYAANWDREFDRVTFWDHLDYIGVNAYFPLAYEDAPADEELKEGFRKALGSIRSVHQRFRTPVLITEIGFTSTAAPWREPHVRDRSKPVNLDDQARVYEIAFSELAGTRSWIRGIYWWKWPSDLEHGGEDHTGFTPNRKPAEDVVRKWYGSGS